jgi:hypothetical protein
MPTILLFFVPEPPPAVDLPRGHGGGRAGRQPVTPMPLPMVNQTGRATGNWQAPPRPAGAHRGQPSSALGTAEVPDNRWRAGRRTTGR